MSTEEVKNCKKVTGNTNGHQNELDKFDPINVKVFVNEEKKTKRPRVIIEEPEGIGNGWCFTDFKEDFKEICEILTELLEDRHIKYAVCQPEICPETGKKHTQGYIYFCKTQRLTGVKKVLSTAHWSYARGTAEENKKYCTKEESQAGEPFEIGTLPKQGKRSDLDKVVEVIKSTGSVTAVAQYCPGEFIKFHKGIEKLVGVLNSKRNWKTKVYWLWGKTGTGKSKWAFENFPNAYVKDPETTWWDGYDGDEDVIIDDYKPVSGGMGITYLLRLFDRYPLPIQVKGGYKQSIIKNIVVTSNFHPDEWWENDKQRDALLRRIDELREVKGDIKYITPKR